ncbi:MAG: hypothetical protein QFX38_01180 [Methanothermobacter sp.]|nr:hypothetical protein [Methanothermobacter sp.]
MNKRGKELLRRLKDLEKDWQEGRISESKYKMLKREYQRELEAIEVAERIKRMQGRSTSEKPLDHWIEKAKEEEELREKEELVKKYVKKPDIKKTEKPQAVFKVVGIILLALAFFIGGGFGLYLLNLSQDQTGTVLVNESAFPTFTINNTNNTTDNYVPTTYYNITRYHEPTTPTTPSEPITPTTPSEPSTNTSR